MTSDWTSEQGVLDRLARNPSELKHLADVIAVLARQGILRRCHTGTDAGRAGPPWEYWGPVAQLFHSHTRNAGYIRDRAEKAAYMEELTKAPPPPEAKQYPGAQCIPLPRRLSRLDGSFEDVLFNRRTHRLFTSQEVSQNSLSTLLQTAFGPQSFADAKELGRVQIRTSPNAGSRHEIEAYVLALNVEDVPAGLYHYNSYSHSLEWLRADFDRPELEEGLVGHTAAPTVPLVCFTTAVTERITYKYREGRSYRLWMYNVGHVGQTFVLAATALGLGAFQTAAFSESILEGKLKIDGDTEFVTYVLGCGHVRSLGSPEDVKRVAIDALG